MPHIIIEYSKNLGDIVELPNLVLELHETLAAQGIDKTRIKTRAISCNYVAVGDRSLHGHMLHLTLLLLEGRDIPTRKKYGDALHAKMHEFMRGVVQHCSITLEVREMTKDTYYM